MNQFYFGMLVVAVVVPQAILANEALMGTLLYRHPRKTSSSRSTSDLKPKVLQCPPDAMGPVCSDDCRTIMTCVAGNLISSTRCIDISSHTYCTPNTYGCTDEPDLSYETCAPRTEPPEEFICTSLGYFPNPHDCTEYFICTVDSLYKYACPPDYVYDARANKCAQNYGTCYIIDCAGTPNGYVVHQGNPAFYAFCSTAEGITDIVLFRCEHWETHIFNLDSISCEFECRGEGRFRHESNQSDFYECYYSDDNVLQRRTQSCPEDYIFDTEVKYCVLSNYCPMECDRMIID